MFFKHFASKNQLPGLSISETLVENGLSKLMSPPFIFILEQNPYSCSYKIIFNEEGVFRYPATIKFFFLQARTTKFTKFNLVCAPRDY